MASDASPGTEDEGRGRQMQLHLMLNSTRRTEKYLSDLFSRREKTCCLMSLFLKPSRRNYFLCENRISP